MTIIKFVNLPLADTLERFDIKVNMSLSVDSSTTSFDELLNARMWIKEAHRQVKIAITKE